MNIDCQDIGYLVCRAVFASSDCTHSASKSVTDHSSLEYNSDHFFREGLKIDSDTSLLTFMMKSYVAFLFFLPSFET